MLMKTGSSAREQDIIAGSEGKCNTAKSNLATDLTGKGIMGVPNGPDRARRWAHFSEYRDQIDLQDHRTKISICTWTCLITFYDKHDQDQDPWARTGTRTMTCAAEERTYRLHGRRGPVDGIRVHLGVQRPRDPRADRLACASVLVQRNISVEGLRHIGMQVERAALGLLGGTA